jgi:hypothetical protein
VRKKRKSCASTARTVVGLREEVEAVQLVVLFECSTAPEVEEAVEGEVRG